MPQPTAVHPPRTPAEWEAYYQLRYAVLRQPWQQPLGSERVPADDEPGTIHALLLADEAAEPPVALAVGMLQPTGAHQGQVRFMAVAPQAVGTGLGRQIMAALENQAQAAGLTEIVLHSREAAVGFYQRLGYAVVEPSHTLFGVIPHFLMRKQL
ncbi:GNAT family N-acetyltransferase [Hymenobacter sp. BT770]|uniref:GNAT family N-acetyltransferase n=1 Tax=Hymenobacter sp. BT770 TaxID=2886942 RepID=UPI001D1112CD|nr:GNAT family N-acetyltransferase [Hymenobacter sp. BT770]MCC3153235.1 GNAT family N-acetyltransferase [Hymenobacter sp. BT770]MDO3414230.1 GNAT family N-acetyltransferase [Hymenobacter sp. BT770]